MNLETIKWICAAIVFPVMGALGTWLLSSWRKRRSKKNHKNAIIRYLSGLPPECKAVLLDFHQHCTHTKLTDPWNPAVNILINSKILSKGAGVGNYHIYCYCTIKPVIWAVMDEWITRDAISINHVIEQYVEPPAKRNAINQLKDANR